MTFTQPQEAPHRRISAARIGQFTGALLIAGGVAAPPGGDGARAAGCPGSSRDTPRYPWVRRRPGR